MKVWLIKFLIKFEKNSVLFSVGGIILTEDSAKNKVDSYIKIFIK